MTTPPSLPLLQLTLRPDLDILLGRWGYQPSPAELPAVYEELARTGLETKCRFWLQDIRRRTLNDPQITQWLFTQYFPDMARQLGGRLYIAYLVGPALHEAISKNPDFMRAERYHNKPFIITLFGDEGTAIEWLQAQQAH